MRINPLTQIKINGLLQEKPLEKNNVNFQDILTESLNKVNDLQFEADKKAIEFSLGNSEVDIHDVMIGMEKANMALQLTIEIRNKIVEAYQEIMRMQV